MKYMKYMNHGSEDPPQGLARPAKRALAEAGIRGLDPLIRFNESEVLKPFAEGVHDEDVSR